MNKSTLTLKIFLLILANDLLDGAAQLFMKKGLVQAGMGTLGLHHLFSFVAQNSSSGFVWLGISLYALNFFLWIVVLSRVDLSIAMPLSNLTYLFTPFIAMFFLHETVNHLRWLGIVLIIAGIHFLSRSARPAALKIS